jgi:hypothetical protein
MMRWSDSSCNARTGILGTFGAYDTVPQGAPDSRYWEWLWGAAKQLPQNTGTRVVTSTTMA